MDGENGVEFFRNWGPSGRPEPQMSSLYSGLENHGKFMNKNTIFFTGFVVRLQPAAFTEDCHESPH